MKEFKDKTPKELQKMIASKREEIRNFRFGSTGSKTKNVKLGKTLKKDIARIMTAIMMKKALEKSEIK
jgi:ribosomal protein L29